MIQKRKKEKKKRNGSKQTEDGVFFFSHGKAYELKHLLAIGNSVWVVFCLHIVYFIYEVVFFFSFSFSLKSFEQDKGVRLRFFFSAFSKCC